MRPIYAKITPEKFQEIYTNKKLRNAIAYAHGWADRHGNTKPGKLALMFPTTYIVEEDMVKEAEAELQKSRKETFEKHKNDLIFVSMGSKIYNANESEINSYRTRTQFKTPDGQEFLFEVSKSNAKNGAFYVSECVCMTMKHPVYPESEYYNWRGMAQGNTYVQNSKDELLEFVNKEFKCNFKKLIVDFYDLSSGTTCISPKK